MVLGAVGDALGFPIEAGVVEKVNGFVSWSLNGELIKEGEYSDDTQLTLSTARSVWNGRFHPEYFAYVELPLWVYYQRGAGQSTRKAAMNLFSLRIQWNENFYMGYEKAGGSGGVMRIYPLVVKIKDEAALIEDVFKNVMITHGHPLAFVGAYLFVVALKSKRNLDEIAFSFCNIIEGLESSLKSLPEISRWLKGRGDSFFPELRREALHIKELLIKSSEVSSYSEYCKVVGEKDHPGSGRGVSLCAVYLYLNFRSRDAIFKAANERGTDTDTIASLVGNLFGKSEDLLDLSEKVQDSMYILELSEEEGKERLVNRSEVRKWASDYEKGVRKGKVPRFHPVFGELEMIESRRKRRFFKTEEGQTILL